MEMKGVLLAAWTITCYLALQVEGRRQTRSEMLIKLLDGYDKRLSPNFDSGSPTEVTVSMYLNSINAISEITMDYGVTMYVRQSWQDDRLAFRSKVNGSTLMLDATMADSIWIPDGFFINLKRGAYHTVTVPNRLVRLRRDGYVFYSARFTLTLSCSMHLQKFPLDTQSCPIFWESYAYPGEKLVWKWAEPKGITWVRRKVEIPQYELIRTETRECNNEYEFTGQYPCLEGRFVLMRDRGYYIIQLYVPTILVVILSWVSFWINIDAIPARISVGVITVLTIATQTSSARSSLPRVSYIKAIDVWMAACQLFVFSSLLEFAFVNVLTRRRTGHNLLNRLSCRGKSKEETQFISHGKDGDLEGDQSRRNAAQEKIGHQQARFVDKISRKLFPVAFLVFNILYWALYLGIPDSTYA